MHLKGKDIRRVRSELGMNHGQFTSWLYANTGEKLTNRELARIESYGRANACNPKQPSNSICLFVSERSAKEISGLTSGLSD